MIAKGPAPGTFPAAGPLHHAQGKDEPAHAEGHRGVAACIPSSWSTWRACPQAGRPPRETTDSACGHLQPRPPPYEQVRLQLADLILGGHLAENDRLPAVRQLAADLGLAAGTIARAYRELESANLVISRMSSSVTGEDDRGVGTAGAGADARGSFCGQCRHRRVLLLTLPVRGLSADRAAVLLRATEFGPPTYASGSLHCSQRSLMGVCSCHEKRSAGFFRHGSRRTQPDFVAASPRRIALR
ncbi:GntR family transcriptional regulator [Streptomyces sp. NBC_01003]|uniref:GntR family transcriptional regulator n=1 Tax=Streptomyces sp. NBC_01003 TaxID=2903714 RepID=UPI00386A19AE